jgi:hypothetical protein
MLEPGLPAERLKQSPGLIERGQRLARTADGQNGVLARGSSRQVRIKSARSSSLIGLQAVSLPSPKTRNGLPDFTRSNWPDSDLKKAVGRTME